MTLFRINPSLITRPARLIPPSRFHTNVPLKANVVNHYEVLSLPSDAPQSDIKKQFYSLSKTHHPDHNPNDPQASERFVKISAAYAILGNESKRERYDRDVFRSSSSSGSGPHEHPSGSHSSAGNNSPFGARPASGLSKRRTQFRGPPPSFYRSGGWGAYGEKRRAHAEDAAAGAAGKAAGSAAAEGGSGADSTAGDDDGGGGGMGYGQGQSGFSNDVPHFDHESHYRTQQQQDRRRRRRRRREMRDGDDQGSNFWTFVVITGLISLAAFPVRTMWSF